MGKNNEELNIINYALMKKRTDALDQKIDDAIVGVFTNGGSVAFENLPALSLDKVGWAYQITDDFTTTSDFVEGAGKNYPAGTFVSIANTGTDASPVLKYNAMLGVIIVDTALSTTSKNAVENRVITTDLLTRLQKVSAMPQNPSNNDLVLWQGNSTYTLGHVYKYVVTIGIPLYAWEISDPGEAYDGVVIYTDSATPATEDVIFKLDGTQYEEGDDPSYAYISFDSENNTITVEIFSGETSLGEKTALRKSSDDTNAIQTKWTDVTAYITAGQKSGTTLGDRATAEGIDTTSSGLASHAEGYRTTASGDNTHSEGYATTASGQASHSEGTDTVASGNYSHSEGAQTTASGLYAHSEGVQTTASGDASHASGEHTIAQRRSQTVMGKYNVADTEGSNVHSDGKYAVIVGNGTSNARSNAMTVDWDGNFVVSGEVEDGNGTKISDCEKSGVAETLVKDTVGWTGKNFIPGAVESENVFGLTLVADDDGRFNVKGTYNRSGYMTNFYDTAKARTLPAGSYVLNGDATNDAGLYLAVTVNSVDYKQDEVFTLSSPTSVQCKLVVPMGALNIPLPVDGLTFSPMIRLASISDPTFEPYHATVDTVKADKVTNATSGNLAGLDSNGNLTDSGVSSTEDVTVEGNPVTFESPFEQDAKSVVVSVKPIQDLHGLPFPYVGGAYKNKLPLVLADIKANNTSGTWSGNVYTINNGTIEVLTDSADNVTGIKANGTFNATTYFTCGVFSFAANTDYLINGLSADSGSCFMAVQNGVTITEVRDYTQNFNTDTDADIYIIINANTSPSNLEFYPMVRDSSVADSTFAPYSNICPISGIDELEIGVSDGESEPTTTTIPLPSTLYGGTVDVDTGVVTVTDGYIASYDGETLPGEWISDRDEYVAGTSPTTGAEVAYKLATPTTISFTPADVELLEGTNVMTTNGEKVAVTYGRSLWQDINDLKTDTEGKLDKSDVADVEGDTASRPYAVNEFMLRSDGFYKVTQPIAQNASITSSNTTKTTVGEVLTALLNA